MAPVWRIQKGYGTTLRFEAGKQVERTLLTGRGSRSESFI